MCVYTFLTAARDDWLGFWELSHILGFHSALVHVHPGVLHSCIPPPLLLLTPPILALLSSLPSSLHAPRETSCGKTRLIFHRVYKSLKLCRVLFFSSKSSRNVAVFTEKIKEKGL